MRPTRCYPLAHLAPVGTVGGCPDDVVRWLLLDRPDPGDDVADWLFDGPIPKIPE